jgi:hypothetical protein
MSAPPSMLRAAVHLLLVLFCTATALVCHTTDCVAGDLSAAEYFIGADPGVGNGIALGPMDGTFDLGPEPVQGTIDTSGLSAGVNRIGLRFRDAQGR